jgi:catechol 2,3-dioxygenase-like lactoylglutathione lyase family enzyme
VIAFTSDVDEMKRFYQEGIGLRPAMDSPAFVPFENDGGASLSLLAVRPDQRREIELCFGTDDIETDVDALRGHGIEFVTEIRDQEFGRTVHFRDPDGNLISLLESKRPTAKPRRAAGEGGRGGATAVATAVAPKLASVIVRSRDYAAARLFYRDRLALVVDDESDHGVRLDAGGTTIEIVHANQTTDPSPSIAIGLDVPDLVDWADEARDRGVHFATVPGDEGDGEFAEALDPEGNLLAFREPREQPAPEEQFALQFDDDTTPHQAAIRTTVKKKAKAVSRVALKPERSEPAGRSRSKAAARRSTLAVSSARGTGPAGTRKKPKRLADPKRARSLPAVGRLKKAERRTLESKKVSVANSSKGKPVKRTAKPARRGKASLKGRTARAR